MNWVAEPLRDVALGTRSSELSPLRWTWFRRSDAGPTSGDPTDPVIQRSSGRRVLIGLSRAF